MTDVVKTKKSIETAKQRERAAALSKQAHALRVSGVSWWDIAEELKIPEVQAKRLVSDRINAVAELVDYHERREFMAMEMDRLDTLQQAVWGAAMTGSIPAVQAVLSIMDRRAKWLGFDNPVQAGTTTNNTIVVPGNSSEYIAVLQAVRQEIGAA